MSESNTNLVFQHKKKYFFLKFLQKKSWRYRKYIWIFLSFFLFAIFIIIKNKTISPTLKWEHKPSEETDNISKARQELIKEVFLHSWNGYKKYGWGKDQYSPVSKTGSNPILSDGAGWIIVDSLDTLYIMGLNQELQDARNWVESSLNFDQNEYISTFEVTIRMLGGLLSAYFLTKDDLYFNKATNLSNRLLNAFNSPSGIPYPSVNLHTGATSGHGEYVQASTAEAATLQLEFKYMSFLLKSKPHWDKAEKVMRVIENNSVEDGLAPIFIGISNGKFGNGLISLGSRGDSYYEYLIKQYLLTQKEEKIYLKMFEEATEGIKKHMIKYSKPSGLTFVAELPNGIGGYVSPKMDHLACFLGGTLALGVTEGLSLEIAKQRNWTEKHENTFKLAENLTRTCFEMYNVTASKISPEIVYFNLDDGNEDIIIHNQDKFNVQRPETVESIFILWRLTKNEIYREWGWRIFEAFRKHTRVEGGYTSVENVLLDPPTLGDNMESFWLAETLKYIYLLFSPDDVLPLDKVVFNTEAHPLPTFNLKSLGFNAGWVQY